MTIGPDLTDYIRLAKPAKHPFKNKREKLSQAQIIQEEERIQKEFANFRPEFISVEKVSTVAIVKSMCVVYPVIDPKIKKLKMII